MHNVTSMSLAFFRNDKRQASKKSRCTDEVFIVTLVQGVDAILDGRRTIVFFLRRTARPLTDHRCDAFLLPL